MELKTLQTIYYSMGIVFMTLTFLGLIALIVLALVMWKKISKIEQQVSKTIEEFRRNPGEKASEVAFDIGAGIAALGTKKLMSFISRRKHKLF